MIDNQTTGQWSVNGLNEQQIRSSFEYEWVCVEVLKKFTDLLDSLSFF
jgi:hypothetical protein